MTKLIGKLMIKNSRKYIKIKQNQLLILDALLNDGGFKKKYIDKSEKTRYSEHSGQLGTQNSSIDRIIVSAKTAREDKDDTEILLPLDLYDTYDYEYFFHTHPPTPRPGGRAIEGILYEFPSVSDIFHFIDHHNSGKTIGSIVVTAEGYYIIFPTHINQKIKYDLELEDKIIDALESVSDIIQEKALQKYGATFSTDYFYETIAKDTTFLKMYNKALGKYLGKQIKIVIKHRIKDIITEKWIIKQLNLPV